MSLSHKFSSIFPYDTVRESQLDGIPRISDALRNNGIVTMEGACGTGKTLTALTPSIEMVQDDSADVDQILCVTRVKQQMEAFQDEIRRINEANNSMNVSAVTLVSVSDLHPYIRNDVSEDGTFEEIDSLREGTRRLATQGIHDYTYKELYDRAENNSADLRYGSEIPSADGISYDPYYAKYRSEYDIEEDNSEEVIPFDIDSVGVITAEDLATVAEKRGYCPHSLMRLAMSHTDVVIGNYRHAFDPMTVERVSIDVISDDTIAILDEAHNLIPTVRDFLTDEQSLSSIQKSMEELEELHLLLRLSEMDKSAVKSIQVNATENEELSSFSSGSTDIEDSLRSVISSSATITTGDKQILSDASVAEELCSEESISKREIRDYIQFLSELESAVDQLVSNSGKMYDGESIDLRDPDTPESDQISDWIRLNQHDHIAKTARKTGEICRLVRAEMADNPKTSSYAVGNLLTSWYNKDNTRYFRSIAISERKQESTYGQYEWQRNLKAELRINNCIPRDEIAEVLDKFHSSVLMSATLEPMDVYKQTTGISQLEDSGRYVEECRYGLSFPDDNRVTVGVPARKFKKSNRGTPFNQRGPVTDNPTRSEYRDIIFDVVQEVDGNILIAMPSYAEAEWIGSLLEQSYICDTDSVFIDESSDDRTTQELKEQFFTSDGAILVTGARGTLVEGVDYIGDRLSATVVCGVPIISTQSSHKQAISTAYNEIFPESNGFNLAFTIPAVRKARQAIGRVIRTDQDIGARILVDKRYINKSIWDSVSEYLSPDEQDEIEYIPSEDLDLRLETFWDMHDE